MIQQKAEDQEAALESQKNHRSFAVSAYSGQREIMERSVVMRWSWIAALALIWVGCTSGPAQVEDELAQKMNRFEISEREVYFDAEGTQVYATVTVPQEKDDAPGVVLIAGSGPTDRDWNNPLLPGDNGTAIELSRRLAEAGVATLRYDKRGTGMTALSEPVVWDDYLAEVQAAVKRLAEEQGVDGQRIFVAGHSEGGVHALRAVADQWIDVQGVILLATPGRSTQELVLAQVAEQLEQVGMPREVVDGELASLQAAMESVRRKERVEARQVSDIPGLVALVETLQAEDAELFAADLLGWEPREAVARIDKPLLIVQGKKDTQVDVDADGRSLLKAAEGTNDDVELVVVDNADHVLKYQEIPRQELGGQFSLTYNAPGRHLDEEVLRALLGWIYER